MLADLQRLLAGLGASALVLIAVGEGAAAVTWAPASSHAAIS
jgi:hypothetical protein